MIFSGKQACFPEKLFILCTLSVNRWVSPDKTYGCHFRETSLFWEKTARERGVERTERFEERQESESYVYADAVGAG